MFKLARSQKNIEQRQVIANTLIEMMKEDNRVVALEADLAEASFFCKIKEECPTQMINVGIAEANMIGIAAGLNLRGKIPFVHSFSPFVTRRAFDQIFVSCSYAKNTINIYGSDPGICAAINGGTHTSLEDIAMFRAIPHTKIFDVADAVQLKWLLTELKNCEGVNYFRTNRKAMPSIYDEGSTFEIGKCNVLIEGQDLLLIAMGETLYPTLQVAEELRKEGIHATVIDMFTIKPLDKENIIIYSQNKKMVVTVENHNINNGLGSAVAEVLAENGLAIKLKRIGIDEQFGQVGPIDYLRKIYGLDKDSILKTIKENI